jgi:uncharacterized membrane protein
MSQPPYPQAPGPEGQPPQQPIQPPQSYYQAPVPPPGTPLNPQQDAEVNKVWGILAYIIFLIPLIAAPKDSRFARFHTNQGLVLALAGIAYGVVSTIITSVLIGAAFATASGAGLGLAGIVSTLLGLVWLAYVALAILGIVNAVNGTVKPLPVIGKFTLLK